MKDKIKKLKPAIGKSGKTPKDKARVTNDTLAEHREEILRGARRYIYPLQHTKNKLVGISVSIFVLAVVAFFGYSAYTLYKEKTNSSFMYKVTKVVPFPVARIGIDFISYENYLFEINHYIHYYENQQQLDFNSDAGQAQLKEFKKRALEKVINDAYIKQIADERGISVSDTEISDEIVVVRNQNRLSDNDEELEAILKEYWNWSIDDFRRSLKNQLLAQKVVSALDTETHDRANAALARIKNGKDFNKLAEELSEDGSTKGRGGEYTFLIDKANRDVSPKTVEALFALKTGEVSEVVDLGYGLEILKNLEQKDNKIRASHILFNFKDINHYLNDIKEQKPSRSYITL